MADELGFWAYRLGNAFPADMRNKLVTLMNESVDPTKGVSEVMRRHNTKVKGKYDYNVLNMCKHPCVCADMYAGLSNHTIWQWGQEGSRTCVVRPKPPPAVKNMVGCRASI